MKITKTKIKDIIIIEPDIFEDDRGWFIESYNKKKLLEIGINIDFIQDNHSYTKNKGTLRGLHFQNNPYSQAKLVSCIKGAVLDVAVDLRKNSDTYKQWVSVELTEKNKNQLLIPRGCAHGFITLTDNVEFFYKVDNEYNKQAEGVINYADTEININWNNNNPNLNERDENAPFLKNSDINF